MSTEMESLHLGQDIQQPLKQENAAMELGPSEPQGAGAKHRRQEQESLSAKPKRFRASWSLSRKHQVLAVLAATVVMTALVFVVHRCYLSAKHRRPGMLPARRLAVGGAGAPDDDQCSAMVSSFSCEDNRSAFSRCFTRCWGCAYAVVDV